MIFPWVIYLMIIPTNKVLYNIINTQSNFYNCVFPMDNTVLYTCQDAGTIWRPYDLWPWGHRRQQLASDVQNASWTYSQPEGKQSFIIYPDLSWSCSRLCPRHIVGTWRSCIGILLKPYYISVLSMVRFTISLPHHTVRWGHYSTMVKQ